MTRSSTDPGRGRVIMLLVPLAACLLMMAVGWRTTQTRGGWPAIEAMILAQAVLLGIVWSTVLPLVRRMASADAPTRLKLAMRAGGRRFLATLVAVVAILAADWTDRRPFLIWIGIGYVVMTMTETIALARWLESIGNKPCP